MPSDGPLVALKLDDLAALSLDLHFNFVAACVLAFDLPDAVIELDLFDLHDSLVERHEPDVFDRDGLSGRRDGKSQVDSEESEYCAH